MKKNIFFLLLSVLALMLYAMKQTHVFVPVVSHYGNDLLYIPLVCFWSHQLMRMVHNSGFQLTHAHVWLNVAVACVAFEIIVPSYNTAYTADVLDAVCYTAGGIFYSLLFISPKPSVILHSANGQ